MRAVKVADKRMYMAEVRKEAEAKIRIVLVDGCEKIRSPLRVLLQKQPDMEVVGEAEDGRTAIELAQQLNPDVIIMDVHVLGMNGIEATREITKQASEVKVIAFSMDLETMIIEEMFKAGASGYLLKSCEVAEIAAAIKAVAAGQSYLSADISADGLENYVPNLSNARVE